MGKVKGAVLGMGDYAMGLKARFSASNEKLLSGGLGTVSPDDAYDLLYTEGFDAFPDIEMNITEGETKYSTEVIRVSRAEFKSPLTEFFPVDELKTAFVEIVEPKDRSAIKGVVVLLPMTGDNYFGFRRRNFALPLAEKGYASVSLMVAYYGKRVPAYQHEHYIQTAYDYGFCGLSCFIEGGKLVEWVHRSYPGIPAGISGLSFGAIMCSGAAILTKTDVVACPCLGGDGFTTFFEGTLSSMMSLPKMTEVEKKDFDDFLSGLNLHEVMAAAVKMGLMDNKKLVVRQVSARFDKIMPLSAATRLNNLLEPHCANYYHKLINRGHASGIANAGKLFVPEIVQAFEEFAEVMQNKN